MCQEVSCKAVSRKAVAGFLAADFFLDTWQHNMGSHTPLCLAATPTPLLPYEVALLPLPLPPSVNAYAFLVPIAC